MDGAALNALAAAAGLDVVGVVPAGPARTWEAYCAWLAQGYAGEMAYLARPDAVARRADPRAVLPSARSVIVVGAAYAGAASPPLPPLHGRVARYAWGEDYHRWLPERLKALVQALELACGPLEARSFVDTGPILERDWAAAAGLGWQGKNACLLHPRLGSYVFFGVILVDLALPSTPTPAFPTCGTCTRCLEACPTGALIAPGVLDARRCLSYLTIEHRGPIPEALRPLIGDRVFGCDVCQEVCPWNRRIATEEASLHATLSLPELLTLDAEGFRARFRHTPLWRATPEGLARNAAVVLGNSEDPAALPVLERAVREHRSPSVREHAAWLLARRRE